MNHHPSPEEWMDFLYEELPTESKQALRRHLANCPECARVLEQWRATMRTLDCWKPRRKGIAPILYLPLLRWAAAAGVILGIGIFLGLMAAGPMQRESLRAELVPLIQRDVLDQLHAQWQTELAAVRQDLSNELTRASESILTASRQETIQVGTEIAREVKAGRIEDRENLRSWLAVLEHRHQSDVAWLRQDLETVAVQADGQLQSARQKLGQLMLASVEKNPLEKQ